MSGSAGLSFTAGDGTSDATMTFTGSIIDINTALDGLSFAPTPDFNGAANLQIVTNDLGNTGSGGALSDTDDVAITVDAVNDAPVNTVPAAQATNEDTTLIFSSGNGNQISIGDMDAGSSSVQVTLTATNGLLTLPGTTGLSFTAGDGVSNRHRFGDVLEKRLGNVEVLNFGLPGSGTDQQLLTFREYAKDLEYDLLLICPFVENIERIVATHRKTVNFSDGKLVEVYRPVWSPGLSRW